MQPVLDAAAHLADEIARTRSHLSVLESALDGMKPLLSRMDPQVVQKALGFSGLNGAARRLDAGVVDVVDIAPAAADATPALAHSVVEAAMPESAASPAPQRRTKRAKSKASAKRVQVKALVKNAAQAAKLPATGTEFWLACMGKRKLTVNEIVDKALAKLSLPAEARPTLYNRLNAWLYPKVKTGELFSPGDKDGIKQYQVVQT